MLADPPPARTFSAHWATRGRSIFELWRLSTGMEGTANTAATSAWLTWARTLSARSSSARSGFDRAAVGTKTTTSTWAPAGPTPTAAAWATSGRAATECSIPTGVMGPLAVVSDVSHPAFDPEPPGVIEVADVAAAMPTGRLRGALLGHPELVVAISHVSGPYAYLTDDAALNRKTAGCFALHIQRGYRHLDPFHGKPNAYSVAGTDLLDLDRG